MNEIGLVVFSSPLQPGFASPVLLCTAVAERILFSIDLISMGELKESYIICLFCMKSSPISHYPLFVLI